jgi:hypothetical protein
MNRHRFLASTAASEAFVRFLKSSFGVTARPKATRSCLGSRAEAVEPPVFSECF